MALSNRQTYVISSEEDVLSWPYPKPAVAAGPGQWRRARKLLAKQFAVTKDPNTACHIICRQGFVVGKLWPDGFRRWIGGSSIT